MTIPAPATKPILREASSEADLAAFSALNLEWLEAFFYIEPEDARILGNPRVHILDKGGRIVVAQEGDEILGCGALIPIAQGDYEFAKMGVSPHAQGKGIGRKILHKSVELARALGAQKLLICTSSTLIAANHLYTSYGFVPSTDPRHHAYARADVQLEFCL